MVAAALATVLAGAAPVRGEPAATLTLRQAVDQALRDGTDAKLARLETAQAGAATGQARSIYWPSAGVTSNAGWSNRQDDTINAVDGQGQLRRYPLSSLGSNAAWLSVYVDQVLFDLRRWRGVQRTQLEEEVAAVQEAAQREAITYAVLREYVSVLRAQRDAVLDAERVEALEWLDRQAETLVRAGRALTSEREQVALALEEAQLQAAAARDAVEPRRTALWLVMGGAPVESPVALDPDSVPAVEVPPGPTIESALAAIPELRILDLRRRMEETTLAQARAERYPTLSMRGGYFHYGTRRFDAFQSEAAIGVDLQIPVFDGFRASSAIEGASEALEAARLRYDATRASKRAQLEELARRLAATSRQPELAERRARLAAERRRLADLALQGQRGSVSDALAARDEMSRTGRAALDARYDRILLWADYEREAGLLANTVAGPMAEQAP